jgi:hypothetical protein
MRNGWIPAMVMATLTVLAVPSAQAGSFGLGANVAFPTGSFGDLYNSGFGVHALIQHPVTPLATITGDVGWTSFSGKDLSLDIGDIGSIPFSGDNLEMWNFTGGAKVNLLPLGLGLEYGYYTQIKEWGLVPYASFGLSKIDLAARYKATGDAKWFEVRVGFMF